MMHGFNPDYWAVQALARSIIEHPFDHEWSVQGFGFIRTYLDPGHVYRLNVWHSALATDNVSLIHDHPWNFKSWVIAGKLDNEIFKEGPLSENDVYEDSTRWYNWGLLVPGPNGGEPIAGAPVRLHLHSCKSYEPAQEPVYEQRYDQIHRTSYQDGTVSLNWRYGRRPQDLARVYWPAGEHWIDAAPKPAVRRDIVLATAAAAERFTAKGG